MYLVWTKSLDRQMWRNVRLFGIYKVFTKRVFLPLTTIYASQAAGLSVAEIGLTTAAGLTAAIVFETTTGYFADKYGRRTSARIGAMLAVFATLLYVFQPSFVGIMSASVVLSIGYAFLSGSMDALVHDSLVVLKRTDEYAKIASRAQSLSLVFNAVIVALVPLLYPIDKRLPFVAGAVAYVILFLLASLLVEPPVSHDPNRHERTFVRAVRQIVTRGSIGFFIIAGLSMSFAISPVDLYNLSFVELGLDPKYMGMMYAAASVFGAIAGLFVHHLRRLSFKQYASFDLLVNMAMMAAIGFSGNLWLVIAVHILNMGLWRYQSIMYQHYILQVYGHTRYKATLLSVTNNFRLMHDVWLTLVFTGIATHIGVINGVAQGVWMLCILWPILMWSIGKFESHRK